MALRRYKNVNSHRTIVIPSPAGGSLYIRPGDIIIQDEDYMSVFMVNLAHEGIVDLGAFGTIPLDSVNPIKSVKLRELDMKEISSAPKEDVMASMIEVSSKTKPGRKKSTSTKSKLKDEVKKKLRRDMLPNST